MPTPEVSIELKTERAITVPVPAAAPDAETLGKFILAAAQDDFRLKSVGLIQEDRGTQRDPYIVTKGLRVVMAQ